MAGFHTKCNETMKEAQIFPIEVDLSRGTFNKSKLSDQLSDDEDEVEEAKEEKEKEEAAEVKEEQLVDTGGYKGIDLLSGD